jgi:hypothetical protein
MTRAKLHALPFSDLVLELEVLNATRTRNLFSEDYSSAINAETTAALEIAETVWKERVLTDATDSLKARARK